MRFLIKSLAAIALAGSVSTAAVAAEVNLLNVSYDPTRELYEEYSKRSTNPIL